MSAWVQFPIPLIKASSWLKLSEVKVHGYLSTCALAGRQPGSREEEQDSSTPFKDALQ